MVLAPRFNVSTPVLLAPRPWEVARSGVVVVTWLALGAKQGAVDLGVMLDAKICDIKRGRHTGPVFFLSIPLCFPHISLDRKPARLLSRPHRPAARQPRLAAPPRPRARPCLATHPRRSSTADVAPPAHPPAHAARAPHRRPARPRRADRTPPVPRPSLPHHPAVLPRAVPSNLTARLGQPCHPALPPAPAWPPIRDTRAP